MNTTFLPFISAVLLLTGAAVRGLTETGLSSSVSSVVGHSSSQDLASTKHVTTADELHDALRSARSGDTIVLEAGRTFVGNFTLSAKPGSEWITIRSSALSELPPSGTRVSPENSAAMPKIISPNSVAALSTEPAASNYRLEGIEFGIADDVMLNHGIVRLGETGGEQNSLDQVPQNLVIDRCYIHGHPVADISRGIALNSGRTSIVNSYISECHGIGFDTQAIGGWNGPGPFDIVNNYVEGSGENIMFGGADPGIPGLVPSDITISRNHIAKPPSWKDGILSPPTQVSSEAAAALGGLVGGNIYYYRIAARGRAGFNTVATSAASDDIAVSLPVGLSAVSLNWSRVPFASEYRVYRTWDSPDAPNRSWVHYTVDTNAFTDVGDAFNSQAGSEPPNKGTRWTVKNLFELKNARRVLIEGNVFENNWLDAQTGYAISFKTSNQSGESPWSVTEEVTFSNNIVRNSGAGITILGRAKHFPSRKTNRIYIRNNLFISIDNAKWGGDGNFLKISNSTGVTVDHNTVLHTGSVIAAYAEVCGNFRFTNNVIAHNRYGIKGDGAPSGKVTLQRYFPGAVLKRNVIAGANPADYPKKNYYPASLEEVGFADQGNVDYRLTASSPYKRAAAKKSDVGADIDKILSATDGVVLR